MNRKEGYIFVGSLRCKVYERYFISQCFHCNEFNPFDNTCPNKNNPAKFGKCAGQDRTKSCRSKFLKCVNCIKAKLSTTKAYEAISRD